VRAREFTTEADITRRDFLKRAAAALAAPAVAKAGPPVSDETSQAVDLAQDPNCMPLYKDGEPLSDLPGRIVPGDQAGPGPGLEPDRWDDPDSSVMRFYRAKQNRCAEIGGTWNAETNSCTQGALGNKKVKTTW